MILKALVLLSLLVVNTVYSAGSSSNPTTCRAVTFSGAGDRGAWETGVIKGILEARNNTPSDYAWQFTTGISAGSINAAAMVMYSVGDELSASEFLVEQWLRLTRENVYVNWPGGPLEGVFFKTGLFDTTPLFNFLDALINPTLIANSDRGILIGATNIDTGLFDRWNKSDPQFTLSVVASSSVPVVFPMITKDNGYSYCDGGATYDTPITDTVRLCYGTGATDVIVDVILEGSLDPIVNVSSFHTIDVVTREARIEILNTHLKDIENVRMAFPDATLNIYTPGEKLPGYVLGFQYSKEMIAMGYKDGLDENGSAKDYSKLDKLKEMVNKYQKNSKK
ncbi:hypothetical protein DICPUDRAFT_33288 [Dictyostelium purpureum]|uniref:PNPLA domain-containing protein n=1 Tax=Dictyostelium purpureum TaxID=5786 RepID=F0ZKK3_DICPU|nr:uncharacterized protein DICPUDRAFT_33288 [Dictyostelium purpureum]EGC35517.1 hypothetical protein DICPUDRAFT_33288 [Dictyostelium purpureum]|eukprot:XP_003287943.1 hypothetical protein DICPUDRAFT_33288 [Dictyostelium purpureum]